MGLTVKKEDMNYDEVSLNDWLEYENPKSCYECEFFTTKEDSEYLFHCGFFDDYCSQNGLCDMFSLKEVYDRSSGS
jgi:hypothetical protein